METFLHGHVVRQPSAGEGVPAAAADTYPHVGDRSGGQGSQGEKEKGGRVSLLQGEGEGDALPPHRGMLRL